MKEFLEAIAKNPEMKEKFEELKSRASVTIAEIVAFAKEHGFDLQDAEAKIAAGLNQTEGGIMGSLGGILKKAEETAEKLLGANKEEK